VPEDVLASDLVLLVAATVIAAPVMLTRARLGRVEGGAFVAAYAVYLGWLLSTRT
jgi:cation:H+ antiporter